MYTAVHQPDDGGRSAILRLLWQAANDPLNGGPRIAKRFQDLDTGNITGGIYYWYDGKSFKTAFAGKVTKYADDFLGAQHDFKVGVQYNSGGGESVNGYNDYIYTYGVAPSYGYVQNPYLERRPDAGPWHLRGRHHPLEPPHAERRAALRLEQGLLQLVPILDRNANEIGSSPAVDKLFDWQVISPRLGATFKLNEAGTTLMKGSCGRYYRGIVTGEFDNATPSIAPRFGSPGPTTPQGIPQDLELFTDNSQTPDRLGLRQPLHRPAHPHLRAPAHRSHWPQRERGLQAERQPVGMA